MSGVRGTPQIELNVGGEARAADFHPPAGATLVFTYVVAGGDMDSDGIAIGANKLTLNDGLIRNSVGNPAVLTHDAVAADAGHKVDAAGGL